MPVSFSVVVEDDHARVIRRLARENNLGEGEVLRQLIEVGLADIEERPRI